MFPQCCLCVSVSLTLLVRLWRHKAAVAIGAFSTCCSLGSFLAPFLAAPFLSTGHGPAPPGPSTKASPSNTTHCQLQGWYNSSAAINGSDSVFDVSDIEHPTHKIFIPYLIIAGVCFLLALGFISQVLCGCSFAHLEDSLTYSSDSKVSGVSGGGMILESRFRPFWFFVVISGFLVLLPCVGRDAATLHFSAAVGAESTLGLSAQSASLISTMSNACRGLGRLIFTFLAGHMSLEVLLSSSGAVPMVLSFCLLVFGMQSWGVYSGLLATFSFWSSPTYPLFVAWVSSHVVTDGYVSAVLTCGQAFGGFVGMWGSGVVFEEYGTSGWFIFEFALSCITISSLIILQIVAYNHSLSRQADERSILNMDSRSSNAEDAEGQPPSLYCNGFIRATAWRDQAAH